MLAERQRRSTRGRRQTASSDEEFWADDTWKEDDSDSEWEVGDEDLLEDDQFDSDFFESESDESDASDADKRLAREERQKKRAKFDYERITRKRLERLANSTRVWSVFEMEEEDTAQVKVKKEGKAKARKTAPKITQEYLLREAAKTETENTRALHAYMSESQAKTLKEANAAQQAKGHTSGEVRIWCSWASNRRINTEELRKSEWQKEKEALLGVHERQLYMFTNINRPKESVLPLGHYHTMSKELPFDQRWPRIVQNARLLDPAVHESLEPGLVGEAPATGTLEPAGLEPNLDLRSFELQRTVNQLTNVKAKYIEPITLVSYNTIDEFRELRNAAREEDAKALIDVSATLIKKIESSVR